MAASSFDNVPLIVAVDEVGASRHVDEVPNGAMCGCFCPAPGCGQPLIAKNGGTKKIHHFAHKVNACSYAVEAGIHAMARDIIAEEGRLLFPELRFFNSATTRFELVSEAKALHVTDAALETISGRAVPDVVVTCRGRNQQPRKFLLVLSLSHPLTDSQKRRLSEQSIDAIGVDLKDIYRAMKVREGKHFDPEKAHAKLQSRELIRRIILNPIEQKSWLANKKTAELAAASAAEKKRLEERKAAERAKAEAKRRKRREAACLLEIHISDERKESVFECPFRYPAASVEYHCKGKAHGGKWCRCNLGFGDGGVICCDAPHVARKAIGEGKCPTCGSNLVKRYSEKNSSWFYGCASKSCKTAIKILDCDHDWQPNVERYSETVDVFERRDERKIAKERYVCSVCGGIFTSKVYADAHVDEEREQIGDPNVNVRMLEDHVMTGGVRSVKVGEKLVWHERVNGRRCSKCGAVSQK